MRVIHSLTGIRALAAGWVVLFHLNELFAPLFPGVPALQPLISAGNLGVDFFFILSGFVISYTYLERLTEKKPGGVRRFLWLRVARIYPLHLVTLLAFAALVIGAGVLGLDLNSQGQYTPINFVMNLFMLQSVPPAFAWNNPAWSISVEFAAYLAFPLLARGISRIRSRALTVALMAGILAAGMIALTLVVGNAEAWAYWAGYVLIWVRIVVGFSVGCLAYWLWRSLGRLRHSPALDALTVIGLAGVVVAALLAPQNTVIVFPALALPFLVLVVLGSAGGTGPVSRVLGSPVLEWGGRISYSVYMTHFLVFTVAVKLLPIDRIAAGSSPVVKTLVLLALALAVVGVGAAGYYGVEEPARRALRRLRLPAARPGRSTRRHSASSVAPAALAPAETPPPVLPGLPAAR